MKREFRIGDLVQHAHLSNPIRIESTERCRMMDWRGIELKVGDLFRVKGNLDAKIVGFLNFTNSYGEPDSYVVYTGCQNSGYFQLVSSVSKKLTRISLP